MDRDFRSHAGRRFRLACALLLIFLLFMIQGCGDGGEDGSDISWEPCGEGLECGSLAVPLDYEDPAGARIDLALVRMPATDPSRRIGSLLTNPGGPGGSGVEFITGGGAGHFPASVRKRFDIVSFDPRGVGGSSPVDCMEDPSGYFATDLTPNDETEYREMVENARWMADACWEKNGDLLRHVGTEDVVRDLERIRVALGGEPLNYVGFSYGTKIGALYAERYPNHIRAMVLDGIAPPSLGIEELAMSQSEGLEKAMGAFLSWCAEAEDCALGGGDPESTFQTLMSDIDQHPLASEGRIMGPGETVYGVVMGLYDRDWWPYLAAALTAAENGETAPLLTLSDLYLGRSKNGAYENMTEANLAIMCIDYPWPSVDDVRELAHEADERFHNLGAFNLNTTLPCSMWPVEPVSRPEIVHAAGAPPIMVIGTTNDPATPYEWATTLAEQMESATLVTLEGEGHVAMGRGNPCIDEAVDRYLTGLVLPEDGKRCEESSGVSAQSFNPLVPRKRFPLPWR